jgi:hypothetical protein
MKKIQSIQSYKSVYFRARKSIENCFHINQFYIELLSLQTFLCFVQDTGINAYNILRIIKASILS